MAAKTQNNKVVGAQKRKVFRESSKKKTTRKKASRKTAKKVTPKVKFEKSLENTIEAAVECCVHNKRSCKTSFHHKCGGSVYGLGFIGAVVYYISTATGFWSGVLGVLKALVWPAMLVFKLLGL